MAQPSKEESFLASIEGCFRGKARRDARFLAWKTKGVPIDRNVVDRVTPPKLRARRTLLAVRGSPSNSAALCATVSRVRRYPAYHKVPKSG